MQVRAALPGDRASISAAYAYAHIYRHRIARASSYAGRGLMVVVLDWADARCRSLGRDGIRMDTWARNTSLIDFYGRFGFRLVGHRRIDADSPLPAHYHDREFALLERALARG